MSQLKANTTLEVNILTFFTNTTTSALDWTTSFEIQGTLSGLWGIKYTDNGSTVNGEDLRITT